METIKGIAVSPGVAISPAFVLGRQLDVIPLESVPPARIEDEVTRVSDAVAVAARGIQQLKDRLRATAVDRYVAILDAHLAILTDERLFNQIASRIREDGYSAEHAVSRVLSEYARALESVDNVYLSERATDIYDIQQRLLAALVGTHGRHIGDFQQPVVIVAHDLTPTETLGLDRDKVAGFATDAGGSTSHTAIVAKALQIPAVVGLTRASIAVAGGDLVIVDGYRGLLVVNPDAATLERYRASQLVTTERERGLGVLKDLPTVTSDGRRIYLHGNIELPAEIDTAVANGADGIGLFRTEFLFMQAGHEPSEEEQYNAYVTAARVLGGKPLTIRTFDLGGDKFAGGMRQTPERNPSLGLRSIRFSFRNPDMFRTQLRAILRAGEIGNVRLLLPMISSLEEVRTAREHIEAVKSQLMAEGTSFGRNVPLGIMVEVPSVAVAPDAFAAEADFFSVGTNDLIQYTLAVERVNENVAPLFTPAHPAILRLLRNIIDVAGRVGIPVSLCGEMGADPLFTMFIVGVGFTQISVAPSAIPSTKELIRSFSYEHARSVAEKALQLADARQVAEFLLSSLPEAARPQSS